MAEKRTTKKQLGKTKKPTKSKMKSPIDQDAGNETTNENVEKAKKWTHEFKESETLPPHAPPEVWPKGKRPRAK
jgi:hypothetical protein